ncbi:MAG: hypothetical protein IPJ19_12000 [Planctomycetes bacterium]|nr:hypothetical protein [Planctomycetota bacterium]
MRLALAGLALALGAARAPAQSRLAWARYELEGPISRPTLELVSGSRTLLEGELLAGEHVERVLPVVVDALGPHGEPRLEWEPDAEHSGRAHFRGWVREGEARWSALPLGLRARPRPPVFPADTTPPLALLLLLGGAALASVALARRGRFGAALPAAAACALSWFLGGAGAELAAPERIVLEGAGQASPWIEVRAGWETLVLAADALPLELESEPEAAAIALRTTLAPGGELTLRANGAALYARRALEPGPGRIREEGQDCADFAAVWWRAEGEWSFRGPWLRGAELPGARAGEAPPGWLESGLPQGPRVCLARSEGTIPRWFRDLGP